MNKDKWISILLDGSVSKEEIFPLIDESYSLVMPKAKKRSKNGSMSIVGVALKQNN